MSVVWFEQRVLSKLSLCDSFGSDNPRLHATRNVRPRPRILFSAIDIRSCHPSSTERALLYRCNLIIPLKFISYIEFRRACQGVTIRGVAGTLNGVSSLTTEVSSYASPIMSSPGSPVRASDSLQYEPILP
jgi:hypothetical protein